MAEAGKAPVPYWSTAPEDVRAALERLEAEREEYAVWIATEDIPVPFGTVLAYKRGTAIPCSNVEQWAYDTDGMGWPEHVVAVKRDSKQGKEILDELDAKARSSGDPGALAAAMREAQSSRPAAKAKAAADNKGGGTE